MLASDKDSPETIGLVRVLFVNVSVESCNTTVPVAFGKVIVLSAVGFVTVRVVSCASSDDPSNIILSSGINKLPSTFNLAGPSALPRSATSI